MLALGSVLSLPTRSVPLAAVAGGLLATALLYLVSGSRDGRSPTALLLTGVVFNAFASAGIVFLASVAGFFEGSRVFLWLIGHLSAVEIDAAGIVARIIGALQPVYNDQEEVVAKSQVKLVYRYKGYNKVQEILVVVHRL